MIRSNFSDSPDVSVSSLSAALSIVKGRKASGGVTCPDGLPPCIEGDCFALAQSHFHVIVVWFQPEDEQKAASPEMAFLENSNNRLVNALSLGIPVIAHRNFSSYEETFKKHDKHVSQGLVYNEKEMMEELHKLMDRSHWEASAREAVTVAARYNPSEVGHVYGDIIAKAHFSRVRKPG